MNPRIVQRRCEACGGTDFRHLFAKDQHEFFRCRGCRLIRSDPQPTDAVLANIYGRKYYDAWGVQTDADRVLQLKQSTFRKHVLGAVRLEKGARVLDCGAAFGALMLVARDLGLEPYGIELAEDAAAEIRARFGMNRVFSGPFERATFRELDIGSFDAVFMCDFIEHVRDPLAVFRKTAQLLRPGGQLVITTPDGDSWSCRAMGRAWPHYKVEHLFFFSRRNIARLLQETGLIVTHSARAKKVLNLEYIRHQFNTYPRAFVTPVVNCLSRAVGERLRNRPTSFSLGEMIVVAAKK